MKRFLFLFAFIGLSLSLIAERYSLNIGEFQKIRVTTNVNVFYHCKADSTGIAWYDADRGKDNIFYLEVNKDGALKIQVTDAYWGKTDLPVLHVYSDFLSSVENSSDMELIVENLTPCASFSANQIGNGTIIAENIRCNNVSASITTGNGTVNLSGKCVNASFRMVGAGLIAADRLQAENVKCSILGTGSIGCWPIDNLNVKGLGTTKIYYKGKPNIKKTGGGKLFELPAESPENEYETGAFPAKVDSFEPIPESEKSTPAIPLEDETPTVVTEDD